MPSDVTKTLSDSVREIFPDEAEIVGDHDLERMASDSRIGEKDAGDQP